jgi:hypothetical protein
MNLTIKYKPDEEVWMRDASTTFAAEDKSKAMHECTRNPTQEVKVPIEENVRGLAMDQHAPTLDL